MVRDETHPAREVRLAAAARQQAGLLLRQLIADRRQSEERAAELGRCDPLKSLTGVSALDRAVESTRAIIDAVESLLCEIETGAPTERAAAPPVVVVRPRAITGPFPPAQSARGDAAAAAGERALMAAP